MRRSEAHAALNRAKARLDPLELYEHPVSVDRVRIIAAGWVFRLPWFRRFDGYAMWHLILLRSRELGKDEDLICHELCHVWQMQHLPLRMPLSYLRFGYARNPYEEQAREAAASTKTGPPGRPTSQPTRPEPGLADQVWGSCSRSMVCTSTALRSWSAVKGPPTPVMSSAGRVDDQHR